MDRIPAEPPVIAPLDNPGSRPLWSVMIPAYNCSRYLAETIESVLVQDPGSAIMQIEVIDDASTDGDVAELVQQIGRGRVGYFRQEMNLGSLRNFETCINRAQGQIIHMLHGDDLVRPGYYETIGQLFEKHPGIGAAFSGYTYIDELGRLRGKGNSIQEHTGIIANWLTRVASSHGLQPPAIAIKRSVFEAIGGYYAVHYGEDWEMWTRIAKNYPVAYTPEVLAAYRVHPDNISSTTFKSGQSLADIETVIGLIGPMIPEESREQVLRLARNHFSRYFMGMAALNFWKDRKSYLQLARKIYRFDPNYANYKTLLKLNLRYISNDLRDGVRKLVKQS